MPVKRVIMPGVEEGFDAEAITRGEEVLVGPVPEGEGKLTA